MKEILLKRCSLMEERKKIFESTGSQEEKLMEVQEIDREIALLDFKFHKIRKKEKNGAYCIAKIKFSKGEEESRELKIVIKDESIPSSFQTSEYIISKDSLLACAIMKTPINSMGIYRTEFAEIAVLVLEKRILQ